MGRAVLLLIFGTLIGLVSGLVYTWVINPVTQTDVSPDSLRADYKEDYVLMVAQAYKTDSNLELAIARLNVLNIANLNQFVADFADKQLKQGASPDDAQTLLVLAQALNSPPGGMP